MLNVVMMLVLGTAAAGDAESQYRALYGQSEQVALSTKSEKDNLQLVAALERHALRDDATPELRTLLWRKVVALGPRTPEELPRVLRATDRLIALVPKERDTARARELDAIGAIYKASGGSQRKRVAVAYVETYLDVVDRQIELREWIPAANSLVDATAVARRDVKRAVPMLERRQESLRAGRSADRELEKLKKRVESFPDHVPTRTKLVQLLLIQIGDPAGAVKTMSSDLPEDLQAAVALSVKDPTDLTPADAARLADWYYPQIVSQLPPNTQESLLRRVQALYQRAPKDQATDARIEEIAKRLQEMAEPRAPRGAVLAMTFEPDTTTRRGGRDVLQDASLYSNDGVAKGVRLVPGPVGSAGEFDGKAAVDLGNPESLQITGDLTIAMWLRPVMIAGLRHNLLGKAYGGEYTVNVWQDQSVLFLCGSAGDNAQPYQSFALRGVRNGQWAHVAIVRDMSAGQIVFYLNGKKGQSKRIGIKQIKASELNVTIGDGYAGKYQGLMDELYILPRVAADDEIQSWYKAGRLPVAKPD